MPAKQDSTVIAQKQQEWYKAVTDALTWNLHAYLALKSSMAGIQDKRKAFFAVTAYISTIYEKMKLANAPLKPSKWMRSMINWSARYTSQTTAPPTAEQFSTESSKYEVGVTLPEYLPMWAGPAEDQIHPPILELQQMFTHFPLPGNEDEMEEVVAGDTGRTPIPATSISRRTSRRSVASGAEAGEASAAAEMTVEKGIELTEDERCDQCKDLGIDICLKIESGVTIINKRVKKGSVTACFRCYEKKVKCSLSISKGAASKEDLAHAVKEIKDFVQSQISALTVELAKQSAKPTRTSFPANRS